MHTTLLKKLVKVTHSDSQVRSVRSLVHINYDRLKFLTYYITNYKMKHRSLTKYEKIKIKLYLQSLS